MVPVGSYERVMPLDILPTQLLRAIIVGDIASAQDLGAWSWMKKTWHYALMYVQVSMNTVPILRDNLSRIEKESMWIKRLWVYAEYSMIYSSAF